MSAVHNHPSQRRSARSNRDTASSEKPLPPTLREVRHARGLTVTQAAERSGLHKGRISELERGERSPRQDELDAVSALYGVRSWRVVFSVVVDEGSGA